MGQRCPRWRRLRRRGLPLGRFERFVGRGRPSFADVSNNQEKSERDIPIVIACSLSMRADHGADVDAGTYVPHLTVRIGSCSPERSLACNLLGVGII